MPTLSEALAIAAQHHEAGQLQIAEQIYRQILAADPNQADALHLLGVLAAQVGQPEAAEAYIRRAIEFNSTEAAYFGNLANALQDQRKFAEAIASFRQALDLTPDDAGTLYNLGCALKDWNKYDEAVGCFRQALALAPDFAAASINLGNVHQAQGKLEQAAACYRRALELNPDFADAHNNLGAVLQKQHLVEEAIKSFRRALELRPEYAEACSNLGNALQNKGKLDEAVACCRRAVELKPDHAEAHSNLGTALHDQGQIEAAMGCFRRALQLKPDYPETLSNLGIALQAQGSLNEAINCFQTALEQKPGLISAHINLGNAFLTTGKLKEAISCFRQALHLDPSSAEAHSNLLYTLHFCPDQNARSIYEEHHRWNEQLAAPLVKTILPHSNDRTPSRRLRVGYVSPNFRDHVVGRNLLPLFREHDRQYFEIVCYSDVRRPDEITSHFSASANRWRNIVGTTDDTLAQLIRDDRIDILVDLTLHMANNRLLVFARQPSPVQVTFAGYPGTTGLSAIDYRLTDPYLDPPGLGDDFYSEESIRLADTFWCYDPLSDQPQVSSLPALESGAITFGCLNNFCKVNPSVLKLWARALGAVARSRMTIMAPAGCHREQTLDILEQEGISRDRITFVANCPRHQYLELYHRIDVGLDTFPYNGHTTSLDSLWMGVPVVTLVGDTVVGRAGLSQLTNLGLPELIAETSDQFVKIAAGLAQDLPRLSNLRSSLRPRMRQSPLMDAPRFARNIEAAYRSIWQRWSVS
jgi:predicted O-linked N-acetylglucosamine transferase (SPINDLY family)